jgi:hypothetical protein
MQWCCPGCTEMVDDACGRSALTLTLDEAARLE